MTPDQVTAEQMAKLHSRCFERPRPWSAAEFAGMLADPVMVVLCDPCGFIVGRVVAAEAEVLTLAVEPLARRGGVGRGLMAAFHREAGARGAGEVFLEVAAGNAAALGLYQALGYVEVGRRRGYYAGGGGLAEDALVLRRGLGGA